MRYKPKKHCRAPHSSWWLASEDAGRGGPRRRSVCKDRWRASKDYGLAREFGDNNAAGTPFRKRSKGKQGLRSEPRLAETVGRGSNICRFHC